MKIKKKDITIIRTETQKRTVRYEKLGDGGTG
jgi:hypothetical protein